MFISKTLSFYKNPLTCAAILHQAENKEVAVHFDKYFGRRPDALFQEGDVLAFAQKKATSFHASEELWSDPLQIKTGMTKKELSSLRIGWDLILDIDCPYWPLSKLITHLFIKALLAHGIASVSVKFSGNKGFHIAVPFESFPDVFQGEPTKDLFPEAPRRIAYYLLDYLSKNYVKVTDSNLIFDGKFKISKKKLMPVFNKPADHFSHVVCTSCDREVSGEKTRLFFYRCSNCGYSEKQKDVIPVHSCKVCHSRFPDPEIVEKTGCGCKTISQTNHVTRFNLLSVIEVDTILIAHRHLYRMPYSFHEKSELVSIPINLVDVLSFSKSSADYRKVDFSIPFLDRSSVVSGEASKLLLASYDFNPDLVDRSKVKKSFTVPSEAIPKDFFPPCIIKMLSGLKDGRKRSLFTLLNFYLGAGWDVDSTESELHDWNKKNDEPLREVNIKGQISYVRKKKSFLPPHNCQRYYRDLGVCFPNEFCNSIKNPLQYAKLLAKKSGFGSEKKGRSKLSDEQKAMRKAYRDKNKLLEETDSNSNSDD